MNARRAILIAGIFVLVIVGFNAPVVLADHPWDEDGLGNGGDVNYTPNGNTDYK